MSTGLMGDNVAAIDALLADCSRVAFGEIAGEGPQTCDGAMQRNVAALFCARRARGRRDPRAFPDMLRRVGSYDLDALPLGNGPNNLAHLLVDSEGTLALRDA